MKDILYYRNNKLPIPFELTLNNKVGLNEKIIYTCKKCGFEYSCKYAFIKNREIYTNQNICYNCINKIENKYLGHSIPNELKNIGNKENPISFELFEKYKDNYTSKRWIKIICSECKKESIVQWCKISSRKYAKNKPICSKCIGKYTTNLNEWKYKNSKAQLIAQNKPETKMKMSIAIKNKIKNDIDFRRKITRYSGKLCGYYNDIKFDSSWELSLLYYYDGKIKPCSIVIPYILNGKEHLYLPDFDLYINNKKYLLEVKGQYRDADYIKLKTAKSLIKNKLIDYDDLMVIDKNNIKSIKGLVLFDSKEKLKLLNSKKIKILKYPKGWV